MTRRAPRREQSSRPDRPTAERSLDALLEGGPLPDGDQPRWQPVSQVLTALTSVPASSELSGEVRALAEFRVRPLHGAEPAPAGRRSRLTGRRQVAGLDNQAVAQLVGRSPGAVRVAAHRGLRHLAATLGETTGGL